MSHDFFNIKYIPDISVDSITTKAEWCWDHPLMCWERFNTLLVHHISFDVSTSTNYNHTWTLISALRAGLTAAAVSYLSEVKLGLWVCSHWSVSICIFMSWNISLMETHSLIPFSHSTIQQQSAEGRRKVSCFMLGIWLFQIWDIWQHVKIYPALL